MEGVLNKNVFLFLTTYALEATTKATVTAKGSALFFIITTCTNTTLNFL